MKTSRTKLASATRRLVTEVYGRLDYGALGPVYCYEGGDEFWRAKRGPCNRLGSRVAVVLTDTANFRNPHYHRETDTVDTLNLEFLSNVVATVTATAIQIAEVRP